MYSVVVFLKAVSSVGSHFNTARPYNKFHTDFRAIVMSDLRVTVSVFCANKHRRVNMTRTYLIQSHFYEKWEYAEKNNETLIDAGDAEKKQQKEQRGLTAVLHTHVCATSFHSWNLPPTENFILNSTSTVHWSSWFLSRLSSSTQTLQSYFLHSQPLNQLENPLHVLKTSSMHSSLCTHTKESITDISVLLTTPTEVNNLVQL